MTTQNERMAIVETEIAAMRKDVNDIKADVRTLLRRESEREGASKSLKTLYGLGVAGLSLMVSLLVAWWKR